jgi:hypothetical protein
MLLPPNSNELSKLQAGVFVLPNELVKQRNNELLLPDDKRLRRSIKAMKTTLKRVGLSSVANVLPETHDGLLPQRLACSALIVAVALPQLWERANCRRRQSRRSRLATTA